MYGSPHADFEVKGKVTDTAGTPIEGIRVSVEPAESAGYLFMSAQTGATGEYRMLDKQWMRMSIKLNVTAKDIDGEANGGEFETQTISIELQESDFKGDDGDWYMGKAEKTVNFTLEKTTTEDTEQE